MLKEIIKYPEPPSVEYSTDVRIFTDEISSLIEDLKDTIINNSLEALTAFQIGSMYNVIVLKQEDGTFLELINPRMLSTKGSITTRESTAYFPGISARVTRHEKISVIYEDRKLQQHSLKAEGDFSILLQRKIDYTFGSSFLNKLSQEEKIIFEKKLERGSDIAISESCPTIFKRDYILKVINFSMLFMILLFLSSFFITSEEGDNFLWSYQLYLFFATLSLTTIYLFYAQYEGQLFSSCTSCQIGNILGTFVIICIKLLLIMIFSYTFIH